jgi:hypothetical protein
MLGEFPSDSQHLVIGRDFRITVILALAADVQFDGPRRGIGSMRWRSALGRRSEYGHVEGPRSCSVSKSAQVTASRNAAISA